MANNRCRKPNLKEKREEMKGVKFIWYTKFHLKESITEAYLPFHVTEFPFPFQLHWLYLSYLMLSPSPPLLCRGKRQFHKLRWLSWNMKNQVSLLSRIAGNYPLYSENNLDILELAVWLKRSCCLSSGFLLQILLDQEMYISLQILLENEKRLEWIIGRKWITKLPRNACDDIVSLFEVIHSLQLWLSPLQNKECRKHK